MLEPTDNGGNGSNGNGKALAPQSAIGTLRAYLNDARVKTQLGEVLPAYLKADRLVKIVVAAAQHNPTLLQCSRESILLSVMEAGQLGLEAGSPIGHAYLVPFRNRKTNKYEATLIIGYRGLIELARRSGEVASVEARVVHERDEFECAFGLTPKLVHRPYLNGDPGPMKLAYAVIRIKGTDNEPIVEIMSKSDIEAIRKRSRASDSGPWVTDYEQMARKTVLRRAMHYAPMPTVMAEVMAREDARDRGEVIDLPPESIAVTEAPKNTRTESVKAKLKAASKHIEVQGPNGESISAEETPPHGDEEFDPHGDPEPEPREREAGED